jgi:putative ABC transport system permease protein
MVRKFQGNLAQIGATILILVGLVFLAIRVSDSAKIGIGFTLSLAIILLVLLAMSALVLFLLRFFLSKTRLHLPSSVRHGLANLYRPGNPSAALLAALGLGVMLIMGVYFIQQTMVRELHVSVDKNLPNMFLVDIATTEVDSIRKLLMAQPGVHAEPEMIPVINSRLIAVNGVPAANVHVKGPQFNGPGGNNRPGDRAPRGMMRNVNLTWASTPDQPPPGDKVTEGKWWTAAQSADSAKNPVVAISYLQAERLGIKPGQKITLSAQDQEFTATVAALYEADTRHAFSRADFVLPEPVLRNLPAIWYGAVHCDNDATAALQRVLYVNFPTVTVINVAATFEVIRQVILQVTYVIQFLAGFSIFAGVVILASSIAGTRYRRIREVVVLKTLGATRPRIATIFSIEFAVLGLVSATVGLIFANIGSALFLHLSKIDFHFQPGVTLIALLITAALTVAAGWLASHRILGQKPLEVLREE